MENASECDNQHGDLPGREFRWSGRGRAPFQVLVLPFRRGADGAEYAVFRRADAGWWQFVAGGGEDNELPIEAAMRETREETGLSSGVVFPLGSQSTVGVMELAGSLRWGPDVLVVPEFAFAVDAGRQALRIGPEHTEHRWVDYQTARDMLRWDSNRNALAELNHRILHWMLPASDS